MSNYLIEIYEESIVGICKILTLTESKAKINIEIRKYLTKKVKQRFANLKKEKENLCESLQQTIKSSQEFEKKIDEIDDDQKCINFIIENDKFAHNFYRRGNIAMYICYASDISDIKIPIKHYQISF